MPELPAAKVERFTSDYAITPYDAGVLTGYESAGGLFRGGGEGGRSGKSGGKLDCGRAAAAAE